MQSVGLSARVAAPPSGDGRSERVIDDALRLVSDAGSRRELAVAEHPTVEMEGVQIARITEAETVASVLIAAQDGPGGWVVTPNVDHLHKMSRSDDLRGLGQDADLAVADGMPLIWFSRLTGTPLPERVAGSSLVWTLTGAASATGQSVFLLGGAPGVAEHAAQRLRAQYPELHVAGTHCPPVGFERDPAQHAAMVEALQAAAPDIVFVALGFPKQERAIVALREALPNAWFVGVGAALSFVAGQTSRAPRWMQRTGLEWVYRLGSEPRRLFRRYVLEDIPFVLPYLVRAARIGARNRVSS